MADIPLQRASSADLFAAVLPDSRDSRPAADLSPHTGLCLARGTPSWPADKHDKGVAFQQQVQRVCALKPSPVYRAAYNRWYKLASKTLEIATWAGKLDGRLFIGLGGASVIETTITLSRTYGVPLIPGSAQKGLARAYGGAIGLTRQQLDVLFGSDAPSADGFEAGYVNFYDAWWMPGSADTPLATEIVTVHHDDYYENSGRHDATDFDSPVPNAQVAARGGFLFAVECGASAWSAFAMNILSQALMTWGVGGKTAAGYGRLLGLDRENKRLEQAQRDAETAALPADERLRGTIARLSPKDLPLLLGRDKGKSKREHGDNWDNFLDLIAEIHGDTLRLWASSDKKNEKKAYKTVFEHR